MQKLIEYLHELINKNLQHEYNSRFVCNTLDFPNQTCEEYVLKWSNVYKKGLLYNDNEEMIRTLYYLNVDKKKIIELLDLKDNSKNKKDIEFQKIIEMIYG